MEFCQIGAIKSPAPVIPAIEETIMTDKEPRDELLLTKEEVRDARRRGFEHLYPEKDYPSDEFPPDFRIDWRLPVEHECAVELDFILNSQIAKARQHYRKRIDRLLERIEKSYPRITVSQDIKEWWERIKAEFQEAGK